MIALKRKLPIPLGSYQGPDAAERLIAPDPGGFSIWAHSPLTPAIVRLTRVATHDIPGSKWVEFALCPSALLIGGVTAYTIPDLRTASITCEWSDFLRLTRWRKRLLERPAEEQALIAQLKLEGSPDIPESERLVLRAIDHPIRNT
jgi:hypothetical protein